MYFKDCVTYVSFEPLGIIRPFELVLGNHGLFLSLEFCELSLHSIYWVMEFAELRTRVLVSIPGVEELLLFILKLEFISIMNFQTNPMILSSYFAQPFEPLALLQYRGILQ